MIVANRDGVLIHAGPLTPEQREQALVAVFSAFLRAHPEELTGGQEAAEASTSPA